MEVTTALVHATLLADAGIDTDYKVIARNAPSASTLKEFIIDAATDSTFDAVEEIVNEGGQIFLMCDKGAKKTSNSHFITLLCWWCKSEKTIKSFNLDANNTDGTAEGEKSRLAINREPRWATGIRIPPRRPEAVVEQEMESYDRNGGARHRISVPV